MTLTVSLVLLFGLFLAVLLKFRALGVGAAIVALLFGFCLSGTDAAEPITQVMSALGTVLADLGK